MNRSQVEINHQRVNNLNSIPDKDQLLRKTSVCKIIDTSVTTLDRMIRNKTFPKGVYITPLTPRWKLSTVLNWIESLHNDNQTQEAA